MARDDRRDRIVGNVRSLSEAADAVATAVARKPNVLSVTFAEGQTALLDVSEHRGRVWADVLKSVHETGRSAYVEVEPETNLITEFLLPLEFRVASVERVDEDKVEVDLVISQARHYVVRSNPDFEEIVETLETARRTNSYVLVTETLDSHEIIDVRLLPDRGSGEPKQARE